MSEIAKSYQFHKKFLQQIMHPGRTAAVAVYMYMLSGQIPIEREIHKRTLGALGGDVVRLNGV